MLEYSRVEKNQTIQQKRICCRTTHTNAAMRMRVVKKWHLGSSPRRTTRRTGEETSLPEYRGPTLWLSLPSQSDIYSHEIKRAFWLMKMCGIRFRFLKKLRMTFEDVSNEFWYWRYTDWLVGGARQRKTCRLSFRKSQTAENISIDF